MTHLPVLIQDLGLILMSAAIVTILFKKMKQPVVLGYLIAGFLVGPHFTFLPTVKDQSSISIWAEIGVIFMLFGLGLEFSFKKLKQVGKSASITAVFEIIFMLVCGYILGQLFGWSKMDSLYLGGILSISSTTIIVRAFEELHLKGRNFVSLVFGVLIVEDLLAILLLVLLTSVAATQTLSGSELLFSALRLVFFMVVWFLLGIYIIPVLLRRFRDLFSDETMLIVSIGLCLMMVVIVSNAGFSPALGAFVMGSILTETPKGHRIEQLTMPVKNLFSAIFFVSVGMLINPKILFDHFNIIIAITIVTIVGKFISSMIGAILSGRSLKTSVQTGMSLAQIGEFSFIIATLGITLKVTSEILYPIAVAVSALTTFATPYMVKYSEDFYLWIDKQLPLAIRNSLTRYETAMATQTESGVLALIWHEYGIKIVLNAVVVIAMTLAVENFLIPQINLEIRSESFFDLVICLFVFTVSAPFLWAIFVGSGITEKHVYKKELILQLTRLQMGLVVTRFIVGFVLIAFVVSRFTSVLAVSGVLLIAIAFMVTSLFSQFSGPIYRKIEARLLANISANDVPTEEKNPVLELAPWDARLVEFQLTAHSPLVMKTLEQSRIKEDFGLTVAVIERGSQKILAPNRHQILVPGDKLFMIGIDESISKAREVFEKAAPEEESSISKSFGLASLTLKSTDSFINKSIRDCGLREAVNGLIVGLERNGQRYLSPDSAMQLLPDDLVWIVGDQSLIKSLRHNKTINIRS